MTDIELTRLCAEAMGLTVIDNSTLRLADGEDKLVHVDRWKGTGLPFVYDPLHDKAQAFELVERLHLQIGKTLRTDGDPHGKWFVSRTDKVDGVNSDLSRAIVECVAKMQKAKK